MKRYTKIGSLAHSCGILLMVCLNERLSTTYTDLSLKKNAEQNMLQVWLANKKIIIFRLVICCRIFPLMPVEAKHGVVIMVLSL